MGHGCQQAVTDRPQSRARQTTGQPQNDDAGNGAAHAQSKGGGEKGTDQDRTDQNPQYSHPCRATPAILHQADNGDDVGQSGFDAGDGAGQGAFCDMDGDCQGGKPGDALILAGCLNT